jgi:Asp-tRNA(Asn)/Glu-tRNA(Gln) amidotransferase C subunit
MQKRPKNRKVPMESMQFNDVKTEQLSKTGEPFIDGIECIEAMEPKKKEDVMEALAFLRAKFRDGAEKLPSEEREKYRNVFQHIIEEFRGMEESLTQAECNPDDRVLQMNGPFRRDETGALCAPKKEDVQASFLQVMRRGEVCHSNRSGVGVCRGELRSHVVWSS